MNVADLQIIGFFLLTICVIIGLLLWWWRQQLPPEPVSLTPPTELIHEPVFLNFVEDVPFHKKDFKLEAQSPPWRARMRTSGQVLEAAGVVHLVFLHGTFVGSDPLGLLPPLQSFLPSMYEKMEDKLQSAMKGAMNRIAHDNGNFLPHYVELFASALGGGIEASLLQWSSGNHHIARLQGAIRLISYLLEQEKPRPGSRILLIGHSHARQVFALFTHLVGQSETGKQLWDFIEREQLGTPRLSRESLRLRQLAFDFVTLGGPVRYAWAFLPGMRALHLINHRGEGLQADPVLGFWQTAAGDYVQQWGTIGSDTLATTGRERQLNRELDPILGKGTDTRLWYSSMMRRERLGNFGLTLLIDYQDQGKLPNFLATVFGHGIYTRYRTMLFQTELICEYLYEAKPVRQSKSFSLSKPI